MLFQLAAPPGMSPASDYASIRIPTHIRTIRKNAPRRILTCFNCFDQASTIAPIRTSSASLNLLPKIYRISFVMESETANAILSIQIDDLRQIIPRHRVQEVLDGSSITDEEVAITYQMAEALRQQAIFTDMTFAQNFKQNFKQSAERAIHDDEALLRIYAAEERRAVQDRNMAYQLSDTHPEHLPGGRDTESHAMSGAIFTNLRFILDRINLPRPSIPSEEDHTDVGATQPQSGDPVIHECVVCSEDVEAVQAPCGDQYCKPCVAQLVTKAIEEEGSFPPKCCGQSIPISLLHPHLSGELTERFQLKAIEIAALDKTYCYVCSNFINPEDTEQNRAHCRNCSERTCTLCKGMFHAGDCPISRSTVNDEEVVKLAKDKGWSKCYNCQHIVEKSYGCNHMMYVLYLQYKSSERLI